MGTAPSILSLAAAGLYMLIVPACLLAALFASRARMPRWHLSAWFALALIFVLLALSRIYGIEEGARDALRTAMRGGGSYDERRLVQALTAAIAFGFVAIFAFVSLRRVRHWMRGRRGKAVTAALGEGAALVFLAMLRLISLHAIDALLYGPFKLNWFADIGASLVVAATAIYYIILSRARR